MKIEAYDVFFEKDSIWSSYNLYPKSRSEFVEMVEWVCYDKEYSGIICDYVIHNEAVPHITILMEHASNQITLREIKEQAHNFYSWFEEFKNPLDETGIF